MFAPGRRITSLTEKPAYVPSAKDEKGEEKIEEKTEAKDEQGENENENENDGGGGGGQRLPSHKLNPFHRTLDVFLQDNDLESRWTQQNWFMSMSNDLLPTGFVGQRMLQVMSLHDSLASKTIYPWFQQELKRIWYVQHIFTADNEELLRSAVTETTRQLVHATIDFVQTTFEVRKAQQGGETQPWKEVHPNSKDYSKKTSTNKVHYSIKLIEKRYRALVASLL